MSEEEAVRVGEAFTRSLELLPGERVLRESRVNRERLFMDVLGLLYLTNQRLIFLPYLYTLSWSPVIVDLTAGSNFGFSTFPLSAWRSCCTAASRPGIPNDSR